MDTKNIENLLWHYIDGTLSGELIPYVEGLIRTEPSVKKTYLLQLLIERCLCGMEDMDSLMPELTDFPDRPLAHAPDKTFAHAPDLKAG